MTTEVLRGIFERDLGKLREEILAYPGEEEVWAVALGIANSGGTLALHLTGNLRHFVGAVLGGTGYERDRDAEFSRRGVPRAEIVAEIDETIREVGRTLAGLDEPTLRGTYPIPYNDSRPTVEYMLVHLLSHLDYHLGQVNYHRRLIGSGEPGTGID
jgi:hypothetical protein